MAFDCTLITPEEQVLEERITEAVVPAHDGLIGILQDRAPLLVRLGVGPLRLDPVNGPKRYFYIEGGVAQMKGNKLTILTDDAVPASAIDAEAARAEFAEAVARRITDERSFEERDRALRRAQTKQHLAARGR